MLTRDRVQSRPSSSWSSISRPRRRSGWRTRSSSSARSTNAASSCDPPSSARLPPAIPTEVLMRWIGLAVVLVLSVALAPLVAEGQQPGKIPRIGYIVLAPLSETPSPERAAFLDGLRELGWIEGKTIAVEYHSAKWNAELLDYLAEELVRTKVDIIVAAGPDPLIRAAKQATSTIPIVMTGGSDPVAERFVASLAR